MKQETGFTYFTLALLAFAGIGLEVLLAFLIEPIIYASPMAEWTVSQNIAHWVITCILWGLVGFGLTRFAKAAYGFSIFEKGKKMKAWQWAAVAILIFVSLLISFFDWNGFKVIIEFYANGWLKFIFQYIYYIFETMLITLILIFAQKAFEKWFHNENIPYGGIILSLTWGVAHFFTKDITTGLVCMFSGLAYGSIYLLVNRDFRKAYFVTFIIFVL